MSAHPSNTADFPRLALAPQPETGAETSPESDSPRPLSAALPINPDPQLDPQFNTPASSNPPDPISPASNSPSPSSPSPNSNSPSSPPSPLPPPRTSAFSPPSSFSEYLDTEFENPARERLRRQAERRANPSDDQIAKQHERNRGYKDKGTPPERIAFPVFNPSPQEAAKVIEEISSPHACFSDIARDHNTTFQALAVFLARPDIEERMGALTAAAVRRAHFVVADNLAAAAHILMETLRAAHDSHDRSGYIPQTSKGFSLLLRSTESIRKTVSLVLRIGNYSPGPRPRPRPPRPPHPPHPPRDLHNSITPQSRDETRGHASTETLSPERETENVSGERANDQAHDIAPQTPSPQSAPDPVSQPEAPQWDSPVWGSPPPAPHPETDSAEIPHAESVPQTGAQPASTAADNTDNTDSTGDESSDDPTHDPANDPHRVAQLIGFVHEADPTALAGLSRAQFLALTKDANRVVCQQYGGDPRLLSREDFFTRFAQAIRFLRDARGIGTDPATDPP